MIAIKDMGLFITLSWLLIITPGPDIIYVITRGVSIGKKAGIISAIGVTLGILIHTLFAAFGLSMILKTSAIAFLTIKYLGAGYLIYLGIKSIMVGKKLQINTSPSINSNKIFLQGILSNVFNPKVALFFIAFLPQFVDTAKVDNSFMSLVFLGLIFAGFGLIFLLSIGYFAGNLGNYLIKNSRIYKTLQYISGVILTLLGFRLLFLKRD